MFANRRFLRGLKCLLCVCLLVGAAHLSSAFVLIGIPNPNELAVNGGAINNNLGPGGAATFGYGGPKDIKRFFRWNIPYMVYSFDASFINYFGRFIFVHF